MTNPIQEGIPKGNQTDYKLTSEANTSHKTVKNLRLQLSDYLVMIDGQAKEIPPFTAISSALEFIKGKALMPKSLYHDYIAQTQFAHQESSTSDNITTDTISKIEATLNVDKYFAQYGGNCKTLNAKLLTLVEKL